MKKIMMTLIFIGLGAGLMTAQSNRSYYRTDYNNRANYRYNYYNSNSSARYIPRNVRKRIAQLEYKLDEEKRCAWRDGYISNREARRIGRLEREINTLYYRYSSNGYARGRYRNSCY